MGLKLSLKGTAFALHAQSEDAGLTPAQKDRFA